MGAILSAAAIAAAVASIATPQALRTESVLARPLHHTVVLRAAPRGRQLVKVGPKSVFGSPIALGVVAVRGGWLKVTSEALPNEHYGWVKAGRDVSVHSDRWQLRVSLSKHKIFVLKRGKIVRRIKVAIGASTSPTPTGRYSIAEKLPGARFGSVYGCCILGLTAHQPHPPAGWSTNVAYYVAIHGGSGLGAAVSAGCLHASAADLHFLMRWIPLGTAIRISR
jgi:L,D-transpeptidase-like protein